MEFAAAEAPVRESEAAVDETDRPLSLPETASQAGAPLEGQPQATDAAEEEGTDPAGGQQARELAEMQQQLPQIPLEMQQGQVGDPSASGAMQQIDPASLVGIPPSLAQLQHLQGTELDASGKFKPIDLESLSPKSRQRVLRNRQAATRSKAKKKELFQVLKDKKLALASEIEQLEAQLAAAHQRLAQLHNENKALADACKCPKE